MIRVDVYFYKDCRLSWWVLSEKVDLVSLNLVKGLKRSLRVYLLRWIDITSNVVFRCIFIRNNKRAKQFYVPVFVPSRP